MATKASAGKPAPAKKTAPVKKVAAKTPAGKPAPAKKAAPVKKAATKAPAKKSAPVAKAAKVKPATRKPETVRKTAEEVSRMSLYYDLYGGLLSVRQQETYRLYYEENLTLSEIAEAIGVSRQGVHEALKKAESSLNEFENKLGLVKKNAEFIEVMRSVEDVAARILGDEAIAALKDKKDTDRIRRNLRKIISAVKTIE